MQEPRWNDGQRFKGRVAVVTGAAGGLGSATARAFGAEGADVVVGYRRSKDTAEKLAEEISAGGTRAEAVPVELTSSDSISTFAAAVRELFGRADVLVNTAGRIDAADAVRFADLRPGPWDELFATDVRGTFEMCQAIVPLMRTAGGGAIVNFSGSYGNGVNQDNLVNSVSVQYCAAKGALRAFTASLARDLAPTIRVNAIAPGAIAANWEADWNIPPEHIEEALAMTPLRRMGAPREIAETVLFLASDGAGYITGQVLHVDGGWLMPG